MGKKELKVRCNVACRRHQAPVNLKVPKLSLFHGEDMLGCISCREIANGRACVYEGMSGN